MHKIVPLKHRCEWGVVTYRDGEPSIEWFDTRDDAITYAESCAGNTMRRVRARRRTSECRGACTACEYTAEDRAWFRAPIGGEL